MFRENEQHRQQSFFSSTSLLPDKLRDKLKQSWAETFYQEVFCRLDETIFAPLYSQEYSRPNAPVNILVALEVLKSGFGWSDEELHEQACFNLQVRHALGLDDLRAEVFTLRTIYNFRQAVREYEKKTGIDLMRQAFEQITDEHLQLVGLAAGWQRMDSTQVLSNLAKMKRLELLLAVLQTVYQQLPENLQQHWGQRWSAYREGRPHQICYKTPKAEVEGHLLAIGRELAALEQELSRQAPDHAALALLQRVLAEQYERDQEGTVQLRPPDEVGTDSLQSPHDPEATYRVKGGKSFRGGYVVNVSETAAPENPLQLITDVQLEPNVTDDAVLLAQALDDQARRGITVTKVTTDGGYTGEQAESACQKHQVELRATRMRGGRSTPPRWGWEEYTWELDDEGQPTHVTCPRGCRVPLLPGKGTERFVGRFEPETCATCPYLKEICRIQLRKQAGPSLYVKLRSIMGARQRQRLHPEDTPIRVLAESTIWSLKHGFPNHKLPVRGLIRARMIIYGAALMVNLRRLHRYLLEKRETAAQKAAFSLSWLKAAFCRCWQRIHGHFSRVAPNLARQYSPSALG